MSSVLVVAVLVGGVLAGRRYWSVQNGEGITRMVGDTWIRLFPAGPLTVAQLQRRIWRQVQTTVTVGVAGNVVVPSSVTVRVHPDDLAVVHDCLNWLSRDLAAGLVALASKRGWQLLGQPTVSLIPDPGRPGGGPLARGTFEERTITLTDKQVLQTSRVLGEALLEATSAKLDNVRLSVDSLTVLGRGPTADIDISDRRVSKRHCEIRELPDGRWQLRDLGSSNGTTRNGALVSAPVTLVAGDDIRLGPAVAYRFREVVAAGAMARTLRS